MPAPGDEIPLGIALGIEARTAARDSMTARMMKVAPSLFHSGGHVGSAKLSTLTGGDKAVIEAEKHSLIQKAGPGAVMAALDDPLYRLVEKALFPFTDIGVRCTPEHRWRAAEHFRPFFAIPALVEAIAPLVKPLAAYSDQELEAEMARRQ